jgi:hypothetical protein
MSIHGTDSMKIFERYQGISSNMQHAQIKKEYDAVVGKLSKYTVET